MFKKLLLIVGCGVLLSGCFMAPLALIGPATSGFTSASILQAGVSSGANYIVKQRTGKTISQHALGTITEEILKQSYLPSQKQIVYRNTAKIKK
tara:strand:+ start:330 stop:611 length:282 start_codon:yes stop_codon:yes gene_type:complete